MLFKQLIMKTLRKLILIVVCFAALSCQDSVSPSIVSRGGAETGGGTTGQGGSLARFIIAKGHLYVVSSDGIYTYSLTDPSNPRFLNKIKIWATVETLYSMNDFLFLGTQSGVEIFSITTPNKPSHISRYEHITSCDPVVARGNYAFSTLRTGGNCNRGENRLDIIDISNIENPFMVKSINLENPKGLGISGDYLFVCDNSKIKTFDISNERNPVAITFIEQDGCFDVIAINQNLMVVGTDGVTQYSINADGSLTEISSINLE